jgi:hypothetical protein
MDEIQAKQQAAAKPVVPDDDIFDDVGGYDLTMRAAEKAGGDAPPSPPGDPPS